MSLEQDTTQLKQLFEAQPFVPPDTSDVIMKDKVAILKNEEENRLRKEKKLKEAFAPDTLAKDVMNLTLSHNQEHLWIYLAKDDRLLPDGRWEASSGGVWDGRPISRANRTYTYQATTGMNVTYEEIMSGAMSMEADEVVFVHNHPVLSSWDIEFLLPPSIDMSGNVVRGDISLANQLSDFAESVGLSARFFIVASYKYHAREGEEPVVHPDQNQVIEFDRTGDIIWISDSLKGYADRLKYWGKYGKNEYEKAVAAELEQQKVEEEPVQ